MSLFLYGNNLDKSRCSDASPLKFFLFSVLSTLIFPPKVLWVYVTFVIKNFLLYQCDYQGIIGFRCPKHFSIWHPFLSFLSTFCTLVSYGWQRLVDCSIFFFHQSFWKTFCSSFICYPSLYLDKKTCDRVV